MKKLPPLVLVSFLVFGCDAFNYEDAHFVGYNASNDNVMVVVNDGAETPIPANRSVSFEVRVPVPKSTVGTTGPSSVDKTVQVGVAFRNLRTGKLTSPIFCMAGAKIVTSVTYSLNSGSENISCNFSY